MIGVHPSSKLPGLSHLDVSCRVPAQPVEAEPQPKVAVRELGLAHELFAPAVLPQPLIPLNKMRAVHGWVNTRTFALLGDGEAVPEAEQPVRALPMHLRHDVLQNLPQPIRPKPPGSTVANKASYCTPDEDQSPWIVQLIIHLLAPLTIQALPNARIHHQPMASVWSDACRVSQPIL